MPSGSRPTPATRQCKLVYSGEYDSAPWANVMWLFLSGSGEITVSELNDLASACSEAYADNFLPHLSTNLELQETQVVLYASGEPIEGLAGSGGFGLISAGTVLPASTAACISWQIAPHYRGGHPRTYLSGLKSGMIQDNTTLYNVWADSIDSAANAFHADLEAISGISSGISSVQHGVVSFVRNGEWRTPPVFYRIAGASVDSRIDTQRRRLGRDRT